MAGFCRAYAGAMNIRSWHRLRRVCHPPLENIAGRVVEQIPPGGLRRALAVQSAIERSLKARNRPEVIACWQEALAELNAITARPPAVLRARAVVAHALAAMQPGAIPDNPQARSRLRETLWAMVRGNKV